MQTEQFVFFVREKTSVFQSSVVKENDSASYLTNHLLQLNFGFENQLYVVKYFANGKTGNYEVISDVYSFLGEVRDLGI